MISNSIENISNEFSLFSRDILNDFNRIIGFNVKRKYRDRKFKFYHKKGIYEYCPFIPTLPTFFAFKLMKRRLEAYKNEI
jgi:hypothetical protein